MRQKPLVITGSGLSLEQLLDVARTNTRVTLSDDPSVRDVIVRSQKRVAALAKSGRSFYGVTTRFGGLADRTLSSRAAAELQENALWVHRTGLGEPLPEEDVRAGMLARMNALARGASGVRPEIIERFSVFLNEGITPHVPELGSIGASGDLVPLSYVVGALIGSKVGYSVSFRKRVIDARSALRAVGLQPIRLRAKEGLAMINGTSMSTGMAGVALGGTRELLAVTLGTHALLVQALDGRVEAFHPFVHEHKPHPGQLWVAARMRSLLNGRQRASRSKEGGAGLVQDRYSVRCLPQFLGPIVEGVLSACDCVRVELNSASDNPLVDGETGEFYYGGNFLGQAPALAMDHLRQYLGLMAKHMDAQIALVMAPEFSRGLPASLIGNPDRAVNMGLKGLQLLGNSIMPTLTFLGNTLIDRFPTHAEQFNQNINSQSFAAARLARESLRLYRFYTAAAVLISLQAIDLRAQIQSGSYDPRPLLSGKLCEFYEAIRSTIGRPPNPKRPYLRNDNEHLLDRDANALVDDLLSRKRLVKALGSEFLA